MRVEGLKINKTILPNCVLLMFEKNVVKILTDSSMHFFLDNLRGSPYIWITLRSSRRNVNFDVRENRSMKYATKKAVKKAAPAKKKAAKKKK